MKKLLLPLLLMIAVASSAQTWNITGNNNIIDSIHFLGTTNTANLKFRVNNQYAGEIDSALSKTFFGYGAGKKTTGASNTGIGLKALNTNTTGFLNTAVGANALQSNTTGYYNTAIGASSLYANTTGYANTATGFESLAQNTSGTMNTANGYYALGSMTTGYHNTATGYYALLRNTQGNDNTAVGYNTLVNSTSSNNTAIGSQALYSNTSGFNNTAVGMRPLYYNTIGSENTAVGGALFLNTTGSYNAGMGGNSLLSNTTGNQNVALGSSSMSYNVSGSMNTAVGVQALLSNTTGTYNTAVGWSALQGASGTNNGAYNTAVGSRSLFKTTNSQYNTVIGSNAGDSYDLGYNNTILGANSDGAFAGQYNMVAIGQGTICPDNSTVRIGNGATWSIGGTVGWTNFSDGRYKRDVKENVKGLEFIMKLRPVTYHLDITGFSKKAKENGGNEWDDNMKTAIKEKETALYSGFIAQEVEKAAKEADYDFSGVDKPRNEYGFYGLRYADFVVPMVKGMQEQQHTIEQQQQTILTQQQAIADLLQRVSALEKKQNLTDLSSPTTNDLAVRPNPSNSAVTITINSTSQSTAAINVYDVKGTLVKQQQATVLNGTNQVTVDMKSLANGTYYFSVEWNNGQIKKTAQVLKQ